MGLTGFYCVLLGFTGFYWVFLGFYLVLPVFMGFIGFYQVLLGFYEVLPVLMGFIRFYWVLLGFTEFYRGVFTRLARSVPALGWLVSCFVLFFFVRGGGRGRRT